MIYCIILYRYTLTFPMGPWARGPKSVAQKNIKNEKCHQMVADRSELDENWCNLIPRPSGTQIQPRTTPFIWLNTCF